MATPNVNFFIHYVPSIKGEDKNMKGKINFEKRNFFSAVNTYNFVEYISQGSQEKIDFIDYSGNLEKSKGLFDEKGLLSNKDKDGLKQLLRKTQSPIWYGLISFEELFGKTYCGTYEDAYELMKKDFPKFLKNAGFKKDNIVWFAGLHENTDNRHIHFSFFEKEPLRRKQKKEGLHFSLGPVSMFSVEKAKLDIELKLTDWHLKVKSIRNELVSETNSYLKNKNNLHALIYKKLKQLILVFPKEGRKGYDSENVKPLHEDIKKIIDLVIKKDPKTLTIFNNYLHLLKEKDEVIKQVCRNNKVDPAKHLLYDKYFDDIYKRLGNKVIESLFYIKKLNKQLDNNKITNSIKKRIEKNNRSKIWNEALALNVRVQDETIKCFEDFIKKLDQSNYKRLIEEGVIDL